MMGLLPNSKSAAFSTEKKDEIAEKLQRTKFGNSPMIRPKPSKPNGKVSMAFGQHSCDFVR
jgi:hypothetical protein